MVSRKACVQDLKDIIDSGDLKNIDFEEFEGYCVAGMKKDSQSVTLNEDKIRIIEVINKPSQFEPDNAVLRIKSKKNNSNVLFITR